MSRPIPAVEDAPACAVPRPRLRRMEDRDVTMVMAIELTAYEFPWTEGIFRDCIRVGYCCRVLELGSEMMGYAVMSVGAGEAHILNLCVRSDHRGRGYGGVLLSELLDRACERGAEIMFLEVRPSNRVARTLYEKMGFNEVGLRSGYYPAHNGREDALVMARQL